MNRLVIFCVAAYVIGFIVAEIRANNRWEAEATERELSAAIARADQGKKDYAKLVEAQNQIASLRRDADRLDADLRRVQRSAENRVRKASASACRDERAAVARCEGLLRESSELLAEGGELLQRNAAVHDALVQLVK